MLKLINTLQRNKLTYKYRRFVTPVTIRIKSSDAIKLSLPKGKYHRYGKNGIYKEGSTTYDSLIDEAVSS